MEAQAITKNVRMSAQKMREIVRQIQGLPAAQASAVLAVVPRKGARVVAKTLKSAMANAEDLKIHKPEFQAFKTDQLRVKLAVAGTASTVKRFIPKARGSAGPILKRSCHVKIIVSDE
jgi:large subunit ribosomal protein L22